MFAGHDLDVKHAWENKKAMDHHRGPHPFEMHRWVYRNLDAATSTEQFVDTLEKLERHLNHDPTILVDEYWNC